MCLQWCHVTRQIVHNDYPCFHCPPEIRFAQIELDCSTCAHYGGMNCALTAMSIPSQRNCCHHNAIQTPMGMLELNMDNIHADQLAFHQVRDLEELFWLVESAPEPNMIHPGVVLVNLEDLSVPYVYGLPASEWE